MDILQIVCGFVTLNRMNSLVAIYSNVNQPDIVIEISVPALQYYNVIEIHLQCNHIMHRAQIQYMSLLTIFHVSS